MAGLRLGFIGYGSIAQAHARAFREMEGVVPAWVVGRDPEGTAAFAREWGFEHWTLDLEEALAGGVDAVVITSPSDMHAAQAITCLEAGKHALVEIPVSTNLADAEAVARAAARTGLAVQVAHTQRYHPALVELSRRIRTGALHAHHLAMRWFFLRRENVNWTGRRRTWTDNLLWHHGCHVVDAALWLLGGEAAGVEAQFGPPHPELGIPLDLDLHFRVGETLVNVAMSYNSPWPVHSYFVIGEEAGLEFRDGKLLGPEGPQWEGSAEGAIPAQDGEWIQAIREGREPEVSPASVLPAMRALAAAEAPAG